MLQGQPYRPSGEDNSQLGGPVHHTESGIYMLGEVVVLYTNGDSPYLASKPPMSLSFNSVLAQQLRHPTSTQRSSLLEDEATLQWLTGQVGRSPEVRRVVDEFLEV